MSWLSKISKYIEKLKYYNSKIYLPQKEYIDVVFESVSLKKKQKQNICVPYYRVKKMFFCI